MTRPPTFRSRSTGGVLMTKASPDQGEQMRFDPVDEPPALLSSEYQGLDGLSNSLAHLIKERRHSHSGQDKERDPSEFHEDQLGAMSVDSSELIGRRAGTPITPQIAVVQPVASSASRSGSANTKAGWESGKAFKGPLSRLSPQMADMVLKSPTRAASSSTSASATVTGSPTYFSTSPASAVGMLRKASVEQQYTSPGGSSHTTSPPESGRTTPRTTSGGKGKHQVLETNHLQLQTHGPSGRRMINQYIIETELGRGVHGKVRLARDTDTGERVAVKIVEREGKKRLGGGQGWLNKQAQGEVVNKRAKGKDREVEGKPEAERTAEPEPPNVDTAVHARFAEEAINVSPPRSPGLAASRPGGGPVSPIAISSAARYGRWGSGAPNRPTYGDKEAERAREKEKAQARKRQLWTTDKKVKREIALLKKCAHENVVRLKEVIDDPSSKKIFMVLEFMEGGEVQWKDERGFPTLTVDEARRTLRDVVLGLEYLHYQGIIHRDIKPANLLWDSNRRVKISDFGVSHFSYALLVASGGLPSQDSDEERMKDPSLVDDHELAKTAGSPAFFAPELCLAGEPLGTSRSHASHSNRGPQRQDEGGGGFPWLHSNRSSPVQTPREEGSRTPATLNRKSRPAITKAIDVWALGVTLYCLLFGHVPFTADSEFALFAIIPKEDYELPAFMGADRIRIGPRKKRWVSLPQWTDEEADVHPDDGQDREADVDPNSLSEEARLVRDLVDRLLEKDPTKRIKLEEVKKHPWVVRDLADPPLWLSETDPTQLPFVQVSNEEVEGALTGFSKIKQTLKRFQSKLFAGLGVQPHHHHDHHQAGSERGMDGGHRRLETSGGAVRRQRSKSASHAHGTGPFDLSSGLERRPGGEREGREVGTSAPALRTHTPKASHPSRPHLFFTRRQSTAVDSNDKHPLAPGGNLLRPGWEKSQSQPNSRPHSPAVDLPPHDGGMGKGSHLEKGHSAHRRPSLFFKRVGTGRGGEAASLSMNPKNISTDALGGTASRLPGSSLPPSRSSSKRGQMTGGANGSGGLQSVAKSELASSPPRSSMDSDAEHWSFISPSQSGNTTLAHSQSSRPRSRSRLSDVFRNVLGHHQHGLERQSSKLRSRPGTASSNMATDRNSNRSLSTGLVTPLPTSLEVGKQAKEEAWQEEEKRESVPMLRKRSSGEKGAGGRIEVDDYDVDLDLSDDDLDEGKGQAHSTTILRNAGRGWILERDHSSSGTAELEGQTSSSGSGASATPSVEGGYNLFKPAYPGKVFAEVQESPVMQSYAMTQVHSDEAEALRRASKKVDQSRLSHLEMDETSLEMQVEQDREADSSAMTEDRFADAEEDGGGGGPRHDGRAHNGQGEGEWEGRGDGEKEKGQEEGDGDGEEEEEEEEEDGCVSFQTRKRAPS